MIEPLTEIDDDVDLSTLPQEEVAQAPEDFDGAVL